MQSVKLILPIMAFILALVTAFAPQAFLVKAAGKRPSDGACVTGTLIGPPFRTCSTSNTAIRCRVVIKDQGEAVQVDAFEKSGTCQNELYYD